MKGGLVKHTEEIQTNLTTHLLYYLITLNICVSALIWCKPFQVGDYFKLA